MEQESKEDGGPAFPCEWDYINSNRAAANGMSLRDYFAAKAMVGLLAEPFTPGSKSTVQLVTGRSSSACEASDHFAEAAYVLADAMLKVRRS